MVLFVFFVFLFMFLKSKNTNISISFHTNFAVLNNLSIIYLIQNTQIDRQHKPQKIHRNCLMDRMLIPNKAACLTTILLLLSYSGKI